MAGTPPTPGLIDTNVLIDLTRRRPAAMAFIAPHMAVRPPDISAVSVMELIEGCRNRKELADLQPFLAAFLVHQTTPQISTTAIGLMCSFTLSHGLDTPDALIAATALELGLSIYTLNTKHFQMIPGLTVLKPY
jgi:tRNA(fMet)-specific endonuclease VapC